MTKKALIITTGGTIVSPKGERGAAPDTKRTEDILRVLTDSFEGSQIEPVVSRIFGDSGIDSSDISPLHWVRITREIIAHQNDDLCGVIIVHGTDTMAFTAAWLALCFDSLALPVILTGSQRTPDQIPTDGPTNVLAAAEMVKKGVSGVWICFDWKMHKGGRAHKKSAAHIDAFCSLGLKYFDINAEWQDLQKFDRRFDSPERSSLEKLVLRSDAELVQASNAVASFFALPGQRFVRAGGEKILILCGFGAGNIPRALHEEIERAYPDEKPLIIACSHAELGVKNPVAYSNVGIGNLAAKGFSVWSQGDYPMEFITALAYCAAFTGSPEELLSKYLKRV